MQRSSVVAVLGSAAKGCSSVWGGANSSLNVSASPSIHLLRSLAQVGEDPLWTIDTDAVLQLACAAEGQAGLGGGLATW